MAEELDCGKHLGHQQRLISAVEYIVGVGFVLGHNVWHVLPNEVFLLFAVGLVSLWLRNRGLRGAGLRPPASWNRTFVASVATAALLVLKDYVTEPIGKFFSHQPQHVSSVISGAHDIKMLLISLAIVWSFAAFGEEIGYRAYLMTRFGEMAGGGRMGKAISLIAVSLLFGFGHFYKGPAGVFDSTVSGLLLGGAYLATGSLWVPILAHGLNDTVAVVGTYFGWSS